MIDLNATRYPMTLREAALRRTASGLDPNRSRDQDWLGRYFPARTISSRGFKCL